MKVSIITAAYNSQRYIRKTLDSINSQTYLDIEHIIVDGCSTDSTLEIIHELKNEKTIVISEKDESMYDAINKGIKMSTGDIIGVLNSDDFLVTNDVIANIVNEMKSTDSCEGVYGNIVKVHNDGSYVRKGIQTDFYGLLSFSRGSIVPHPTLYIKKELHERIGGYDLSYKFASDFDYILRVLKETNLKYMDQNITAFRVHPDSITSSGRIKNERNQIIKKFTATYPIKRRLKLFYNFMFFMRNRDAMMHIIRCKFER